MITGIDQSRPHSVLLRRQRRHERRVRQRIDQLDRRTGRDQLPPQFGIGEAQVDQHDGDEVTTGIDAQEA